MLLNLHPQFSQCYLPSQLLSLCQDRLGPEPKSDFALIEELLEEELGSLEGKELPLGRGQGFIHGPGWKWGVDGVDRFRYNPKLLEDSLLAIGELTCFSRGLRSTRGCCRS